MPVDRSEGLRAWCEQDAFLGVRDQRPEIDAAMRGLSDTFQRTRDLASKRLTEISSSIQAQLQAADEAVEQARASLAVGFEALAAAAAPDVRGVRRVATELDTRQAALYQRVRLAPGRAFPMSPRRTLASILADIGEIHRAAIASLPETVRIIRPRRNGVPVPPGQRLCDVHDEALLAAANGSRLRLAGELQVRMLKVRLQVQYDIMHVPMREIAHEYLHGHGSVDQPALQKAYGEVHQEATAKLDEVWNAIRFNLEVAIDELQASAQQTDGWQEKVVELQQVALGALDRAREIIAAILEPYDECVKQVLAEVERDQTTTLEQIRHDIEAAANLQVRLSWRRRRLAAALRDRKTAVTRWLRAAGKRITGVGRRLYTRGEDVIDEVGATLGIQPQAAATVLGFADLPTAEDMVERDKDLPPIYRRLFATEPLRSRELLVGRDKELAVLSEATQRWKSERPCSVAIVGPNGSGKTSLLNCFEVEVGDLPVRRFEITARMNDVADVLALMSSLFELPEPAADPEQLVAQLLQLPRQIVMLEGGHNLMLRTIGGRKAPEAFFAILMATRAHMLWVVTVRRYPWMRLNDQLKAGRYFTHLIETPFHSSAELREAVMLRQRNSGFRLSFSTNGVTDRKIKKLLLTQAPDSERVQEALRDKFFEALFSVSGGNMKSVLYYWLLSLSPDPNGETVSVAPCHRPDMRFLQQFERGYLFTLAEVLNHGTLTAQEHSRVFRMAESQSTVILDYLHQLQLVRVVQRPDAGSDAAEAYEINPVFMHMVSSALGTMSVLY